MGKFKQSIGQKIRERRKLMGFKTQETLAAAIGADRTRVSRWESGENLPDPVYKEALAKALKVDESFFEEPEEGTPGKADMLDRFDDLLDALESKLNAPKPQEFPERADYERLKALELDCSEKDSSSMSPEKKELVELVMRLKPGDLDTITRIVRRRLTGNPGKLQDLRKTK